jgi:alanine racemase
VAEGRLRPVWAEVDLAAVRHNAALLARVSAPARLCAVVKADGYGHGAVAVAGAALEGGASWLAVAMVEEGIELRDAGIGAPVLLLSEPDAGAMEEAVAAGITPTVYTRAGVEAAAASARRAPVAVHVKLDTGMHRVGADAEEAVAVVEAVAGDPRLELEALWTHLAVAEDTADPFTAEQLGHLDEVVKAAAARGAVPRMVHAANSAAAIAHPGARYDLVRCGIALYGYAPSRAVADTLATGAGAGGRLRPVLSLRARVSHVRRLGAGTRISYGRRYRLERDSVVATVPIGYADGVPRRLFGAGGEVLLGGVRRRIAGTVTMDQLMVDCGPDAVVAPGDEVVLIGTQGVERIDAEEWAERLGTISYEVLSGVGRRVPRISVDGATATDPPSW